MLAGDARIRKAKQTERESCSPEKPYEGRTVLVSFCLHVAARLTANGCQEGPFTPRECLRYQISTSTLVLAEAQSCQAHLFTAYWGHQGQAERERQSENLKGDTTMTHRYCIPPQFYCIFPAGMKNLRPREAALMMLMYLSPYSIDTLKVPVFICIFLKWLNCPLHLTLRTRVARIHAGNNKW